MVSGSVIVAGGIGALVGGMVAYFMGYKDGCEETRIAQARPARRIASR